MTQNALMRKMQDEIVALRHKLAAIGAEASHHPAPASEGDAAADAVKAEAAAREKKLQEEISALRHQNALLQQIRSSEVQAVPYSRLGPARYNRSGPARYSRWGPLRYIRLGSVRYTSLLYVTLLSLYHGIRVSVPLLCHSLVNPRLVFC